MISTNRSPDNCSLQVNRHRQRRPIDSDDLSAYNSGANAQIWMKLEPEQRLGPDAHFIQIISLDTIEWSNNNN